MFEMMGMGSGNIYQLHLFIIQHFFIGTVGTGETPPVGKVTGSLQLAGRDCISFYSLHSFEGDCHLFGNPSGTYNTYFDSIHTLSGNG